MMIFVADSHQNMFPKLGTKQGHDLGGTAIVPHLHFPDRNLCHLTRRHTMEGLLKQTLHTVVNLIRGLAASKLSHDMELEELHRTVTTELQRQENALTALREMDLKTAVRYLKLAVVGGISDAGVQESKEDYKTAEKSAVDAFAVVPTTMQKVEATKIAIIAGFFYALGSDPASSGLKKGLQRAGHHLHQLLQDEKVMKVTKMEKQSLLQSLVGGEKRKELAASVGGAIKGFLDLSRMGPPNEGVHLLDDGPSLLQILANLSFGKMQILKGHEHWVWSLAAEGEWLFSGSGDNTIRIWRLGTWECVHILKGHTGRVSALATNGTRLFSGSGDRTVRVWELNTWKCVRVFEGHSHQVFSLAATEDWLVACFWDKTIRVWQIDDWECTRVLEAHSDWVCSLVVTDTWLFSGSKDHTIRVWRTGCWECECVLEGHSSSVGTLAVTNEWLFSGSDDKSIRAWKMGSWECAHVLEGHTHEVTAMAIHDHCLCSATKSPSEAFSVWSLDTWDCLRVLDGHGPDVRSLVVAGDWIASIADDQTIQVWRAVP
ncbi:unnamed protein product [Ostreobium quekettii]|uniref:Uncharacterized protein n=1 Tax=Ostreobium quekettii TaxID=121088 RepID=A0A8S1J908_9CHLO|nr:unnamed protein product [Ostreobium quekettii]